MLKVTQMGSGPDLLLIHGWGLNRAVWQGVAVRLASHYTLHLIDLPGHGSNSAWKGSFDLATTTQAVINSAPKGAIWLGWSLGGMVALSAAAGGAHISKLILTAATPKFCRSGDWHAAIGLNVLEQFGDALRQNYKLALLRFLALQARGSDHSRDEIRTLRKALFIHGEPDVRALAAGLESLQYEDLRPTAGKISQPVLVINGLRDTLVPGAAAEWFGQHLQNCTVREITGAGHAPFLSHPDQFVAAVEAFCDE